jgi:hypothetical protein
MDYQSTYPVTPYAPGVDPMNDMANPDWANYAMEQKRRKLQDELRNKAKNQQGNSALNENLPKKFVTKKEIDAGMQKPAQSLSKPKKSSKIKDAGQIATTLPPFVKTQPSESLGFGLTTPETSEMNLPPVLGEYNKPSVNYDPESLQTQPSAIRDNVTSYIPNEPRAMSAQPMVEQPSNDLDFRSKLYEYLRKKISGDPMDADRLARMNKAREYAAANQFGASLADSASKMGTLQGKRSEVGNFQPLIESIYERDMGKIGDELALEKQRDESLLRGASLSSKILKSAEPKTPKILPYYKPSTSEQPGEIIMYDEAGNLMPRQLPPGYEPNNPWSTLPMFMDAKGNPVIIERNPVTGQTRQLPIPDNLKTLEQAKMEANNVLRKIDSDIKVAGEQRRGELMREQVRYQQYLSQLRQKEFELRLREQEERERANRAREGIQKAKGGTAGGAKRLSPSDIKKFGEGRDMPQLVSNFRNEMKKYKYLFGPMKGKFGSANAYNAEAQQYEAASKLTAQSVGKYLEGGKLTDADVPKYQAMLPKIDDLPSVAEYKLNQIDKILRERHAADIKALEAQGYDVGGLMFENQNKEPRKVIKKFHDKANNKTKYIFNYGPEEVVNGLK